jgi:hypothetical protein
MVAMPAREEFSGQKTMLPRVGLRPREAACVLRVSERMVANMVRRGLLRDVAAQRCRRIDPEQLAEMVADDPSAREILAGLLDGSLRVSPSTGGDSVPTARACPMPCFARISSKTSGCLTCDIDARQ